MKGFFAVLFILIGMTAQGQQKGNWVLSKVNVVDIENDSLLTAKDVFIKGGAILSILPHKNTKYKSFAIVDGTGKYLIPGLWDNHVHFGGGDSLLEENKNLLPLYLAHGITAVRDAAADISPAVLQWRKELSEGKLLGPRIFTSGPKIEGINSIWIGDIEIGDEAGLGKAIDSLKKLEVDFIKITDNTLKPDLYLKAVQLARSNNWPVSGHIPYALTMKQVADAGLTTIEHMGYLLKAGADEVISNLYSKGFLQGREVMPLALAVFDTAKALATYRYLATKGTGIVPTLLISSITSNFDNSNHWNDSYLKYLGTGLKNTYWWRIKRAAGDNADAIEMRHRVFEATASLIPLVVQSGMTIMAGTDAGYLNSFVYPGLGLHLELELLVKYGLTPAQALKASILNGPSYFKLSNNYGKVEAGFAADLLLLDENPLKNISATQKIHAVMKSGNLFSRQQLDQILNEVQIAATNSKFKPITQ